MLQTDPLAVTLETSSVQLPPGASDEIRVRLENQTSSEIRGEAQLLSLYGTWEAPTP